MVYSWQDLKKKLREKSGKGRKKKVDKPIKNLNKRPGIKERRIPSLRLDAFKDKAEALEKLKKMPEKERELLLNKTIRQKEKLIEISQDQNKKKKAQKVQEDVKELKKLKRELESAS